MDHNDWSAQDSPAGSTPPPERVLRASRGLIIGIAFAILAIWLFIRLSDVVMESETQHLDAGIIHYFAVHATPTMHALMAGITWLGSGESQAVVAVAVAIYFLLKRRFIPDGMTMLVAVYGGMLVDEGLKRVFHRVRPEPVFYHLGYSFPSGHAFSAVVVYGLIAYWLSQSGSRAQKAFVWTAAVLLMLLVGFSRVYLRQHYPTDVLGGYLSGACWLWGCIMWMHLLERSRARLIPTEQVVKGQ